MCLWLHNAAKRPAKVMHFRVALFLMRRVEPLFTAVSRTKEHITGSAKCASVLANKPWVAIGSLIITLSQSMG